MMKSKLSLSDNQMTKIINMFREERPEMDYKNLPRNGKNLSKGLRTYLKGEGHIRRVQDGMRGIDQEPLHARAVALKLKKKIRKKPIRKEGDVADFSIQDSLFNLGPGMVHAARHRRMLMRVEAANPNLLSPALLKTMDEAKYNKEKMDGTLGNRPCMNYFSLKLHADGVQIAKNGRKPQAIPILAAIDTIAAYNPETKIINGESSVRLPIRQVRPFIVSFYHGYKKPNQYQFLSKLMDELVLLDPDNEDCNDRLCVVQIHCIICDSPMKSWLTGMISKQLHGDCCVLMILPSLQGAKDMEAFNRVKGAKSRGRRCQVGGRKIWLCKDALLPVVYKWMGLQFNEQSTTPLLKRTQEEQRRDGSIIITMPCTVRHSWTWVLIV